MSRYPIAEHLVRKAAPEMAEDLISKQKQFPSAIKGIANKLSVYGFEPFCQNSCEDQIEENLATYVGRRTPP